MRGLRSSGRFRTSMPNKKPIARTSRPRSLPTLGEEVKLVSTVAILLTAASLAFCARHGYLLLYGDAVAHLHIARRIFDSSNPGLSQLGSVWLPLPHLLLLAVCAANVVVAERAGGCDSHPWRAM